MKQRGLFMAVLCCLCVAALPAQDLEDEHEVEFLPQEKTSGGSGQDANIKAIVSREKIYPEAKRPKPVAKEAAALSAERTGEHAGDDYVKDVTDTFRYGLEEEIANQIDEISKNGDLRFVEPIYDLFQETKNPSIRCKILDYFAKLKDPCLEDYACEVINDPYDQKRDTVDACFKYAAAVECVAALPGLVTLVDKEDEQYFDGALACLGEIGGTDEALFLASYLDRDDLTVSQRQALMKVLGRIKAVETWDRLSEIAQDENENTFVRMYAAEAIGAMEKPESEDILLDLFEDDDPNLRVYVLKGLSHFSDKRADGVIIQALRDSQYKVRLEAIASVETRGMGAAAPYLVYRCKDSKEQRQIKEKCYEVLAKLNTAEGNEYLIGLLNDKKTGDSVKVKVAAALLEQNNAGTAEVIALARDSLKNDTRKSLRYALGKEFAKYGRAEFSDICAEYIASSDVATQGTGLDIFAKGRYQSVRAAVEAIAADDEDAAARENEERLKSAGGTADGSKKPGYYRKKTANANAKKAKRVLALADSL